MDLINDVWREARPQAVTALAGILLTILSIVSVWLAVKASAALKTIKDDKLALSLYRTIDNVLKATLARRVINGVSVGPEMTTAIVKQVLEGTKENNPKSVGELKQTDTALIDKITARLPEAKAAVVEAAAKAA